MEKNSSVRRSVTTGEGRQWQGLRQRWGMLGLFEIKQDHEFYDLTSVMKEGLHAAVQPSVENPPPVRDKRKKYLTCKMIFKKIPLASVVM